MVEMKELFAGTFLAEISEILETEDFEPIIREKREKETTIREMTPLEKAFQTLMKRSEGEGERVLHSVLWDLLIKPNLPQEQRDKPLAIRTGFIIVETPETQFE
ncbi:MAG: hypothetical protein PHR36_04805 [Patescibacteria group bacterium]|nr:hypothetical protein [Patescibacteria group bacterium]